MGNVICLGGLKMNKVIRQEPATKVAKWFLKNNESLDENSGDSNLKLQKLIFYAQGMHLAVFNEPFYGEEIQAWENGPVVKEVYEQYRYSCLGYRAKQEDVKFSGFQEDILRVINIVYGDKTSSELVDLTHEEDPWKELGVLAKQRQNPIITKVRMAEYYRCLKDIFEAYIDYNVEETSYRIGSNTIKHEADMELTGEERDLVKEVVYDRVGSDIYVSKDSDGGLVIY